MAIAIFTMINGMGVAFLVYVLIRFVQEGRRPKFARRRVIEFSNGRNADVLVVTHPITHSGQAGISVFPRMAEARQSRGKQLLPESADVTLKMPERRFSAR